MSSDLEPSALSLRHCVGLALAATFARAIAIVLLAPAFGGGAALLGIATLAAFGVAFALTAPRVPSPPGRSLGFTTAPALCWAAVPLLAPSLLLISELENLTRELVPPPLAPTAESGAGSESGPTGTVAWLELALVFVAILPLCEEIFFRGLLQPTATRALGASGGVALIAALHGGAWALPQIPAGLGPCLSSFVTYAGMGLVLGALREASRSLVPGICLAMLFGMVLVLAAAKAFGIAGFDDTTEAHTPLAWLAPAALLVGVGLGLCRLAAPRAGAGA